MMKLLKNFWHTLIVIGSLIGLLYLPVDIEGLPDALKPINTVVRMIDRETYLLVLVALFGSWIVWTDIRPFALQWWRKKFGRDIERERQRAIIFKKTGKLRVDLASRIARIVSKGPSAFRTLQEIDEEFETLIEDTDTFMGMGDLTFYMSDFHESMKRFWLSLTYIEDGHLWFCNRAYYPFQQQCQLASNYARYWLMGESPSLEKYIEENQYGLQKHHNAGSIFFLENMLIKSVWGDSIGINEDVEYPPELLQDTETEKPLKNPHD